VETFYKEVLLVGQQQQQQDRALLNQILRNDLIIPDFEAFRQVFEKLILVGTGSVLYKIVVPVFLTNRYGTRVWHRDTLVGTACRLCSGFCMGLIYCCPIQLGGEISTTLAIYPPSHSLFLSPAHSLSPCLFLVIAKF
jgi:hypothetical protein